MQKVRSQHITEILKLYGINKSIRNIIFLCERYSNEENLRIRVICKAELCDKTSYIIKFILEEEHPQELIEEQSIFSECLRNYGINTAKRFKCEENYCFSYKLNNSNLSVTLEEYLGDEVQIINKDIVKEIAILMGKMHNISEKNKCHINKDTIWNLWNDNSDIMRGYIQFKELRNKILKLNESNFNLYEEILQLYENRKSKLYAVSSKLPKYATQGDYSVNNLTYANQHIGIFDYNIAGDEVLVNDMIIEGLFITKSMDLDEDLREDNRDELFKIFVRSYMNIRNLTPEEIKVINDIYAIVVPFWWDRIIYDEHESLVSILESKDVNRLNKFLEETYTILSSNYFDVDNFYIVQGDSYE